MTRMNPNGIRNFLLIATFVLFTSPSAALASDGLYSLSSKGVGKHTLLTLRDRKSGRRIWTRKFDIVDEVAWSHDGSQVAIMYVNRLALNHHIEQVALWSRGRYVHRVPGLTPRYDGVEQASWSADDTRILFRFSMGQGLGSIDCGHIWVLDAKRVRLTKIAGGLIDATRWIGPRKIRYAILNLREITHTYRTVTVP